MAKVWAIVEVPYTQTNAWVMAVWAKVMGQVNGLFFPELENLYFTPNPSCFAIASFGAAQKSLRTRAKSKDNMKKLVFSDL
jgi:hypothetical protein